jgi:hypothetical protein
MIPMQVTIRLALIAAAAVGSLLLSTPAAWAQG